MERKLDRLNYTGQECIDKNRQNPISTAQRRVISIIERYFEAEFCGATFGEAWDFISLYDGRVYTDEYGITKRITVSTSYINQIETNQNIEEKNNVLETIKLDQFELDDFYKEVKMAYYEKEGYREFLPEEYVYHLYYENSESDEELD